MKPIELSFGAYGLLVHIESRFDDSSFHLDSLISVGEIPTSIRRLITELIDRGHLEQLPQSRIPRTWYWSEASYQLKRDYLQPQRKSK
jgi:hypothetical protein